MQTNGAIGAPDRSRARGTWTTAVYWLLRLGLGGLILATGVGKALDVPGFIVAQSLGAAAATILFRWLVPARLEATGEAR